MKTRKVGRVLSVLLAIVMVVGLMIPASSVLADTVTESAYADVNWTDENTVAQAATHAQLKAALKNAPTDGTVQYINITENINVPKFATSGDGYYLGTALYLVDFFRAAADGAWVTPYEQKYPGTEATDATRAYDLDEMHELIFKSDSSVAQEWVKRHKSGPLSFMSTNTDFSKGHYFTITDTDDYQFAVKMFKMNPAPEDLDLFGVKEDESGNIVYSQGKSWESTALIVFPNTNVVINFNGHTVSLDDYYGSGNSAFKGDPAIMSSVFTVFGDLTILGNGTITGGTGYIMDFKTTSTANTYTNYTAHASDWSAVEKKTEIEHGIYAIQSDASKPYLTKWTRANFYGRSSTGAHGGGVYVAPKASFTMYSGTITGNCTWMDNSKPMFKSDVAIAQGGGVYVGANATFNMYGGEISNNASRAYSKTGTSNADILLTKDAKAQGGGVYLDGNNATMNFTGGKICDNGSYAETRWNKTPRSEGAGVYVGEGATLNILGSAKVTTDINTDLENFPQIVGNSCGAAARESSDALYVLGAGIYAAGTVNIRRAVVASNDFSELAKDNDNEDTKNLVPAGADIVCVARDEATGLAKHDKNGNIVTTPTRYDVANGLNGWTSADSDKILYHEESAKFGVYRASSSTAINSSGAGIYVGSNAKITLGDRTWVYDNYDLVTNGHKAFGDIRSYKRTIAEADSDGNVPYGGYVYSETDGTETPIVAYKYKNTNYYAKPGDGRTWSDTRDDIYLPEGKAFNVGESLFECKIGVNYYDMVGPGAKPEEKAQKPLGANSNRVFVVSANDLDYDVWGTTSATPRPRDIQFFYLNDNNKEWEYANYQMPAVAKRDGLVNTTLYTEKSKSSPKANVANESDVNFNSSPFEGYVDYNTAHPKGTWWWSTANAGVQWSKYEQQVTYPRVESSSSNPLYPQISTELSTSSDVVNTAVNRAKYMDYKVIWDDNATEGFATGATQPVLRFGTAVDRKMYVTIDFSEANKTYFAIAKNQDLQTNNTVDSYSSTRKEYTTVNGLTFGGVNAPAYSGIIEVGIPVPNYNIYKGNLLETTVDGAITSITDEKGNFINTDTVETAKEAPDLYFKNWSFYTSYGYGPEPHRPKSIQGMTSAEIDDITKSKKVDELGSMLTRGTFNIKLSNINNTNLNAQPCPTLTAMWYSQDELLEARKRISNVMVQRITKKDGTPAFRFMALVGSDYAEYETAGFVYSLTNATPTIEGGYKYTEVKNIYKKMWTVNNQYPKGVWTEVSYLLDPDLNHPSRSEYKWTFLTSSFKDNLKKNNYGYPVAGILYSDLDMSEFSKDAIVYVTPYLKKGDTYYYGESRGVSYNYALANDKAAGITEG